MHRTVDDAIAAGALSSICYYHHCIGAKLDDWSKTREFAKREFTWLDDEWIDALIDAARTARNRGVAWQSAMTLVSQLNESTTTEK